MNYENTIIPFNENPKILTNDVADTLGVPKNDLAYNRPFRLCADSRVNMFSLNKPLWRTCNFHSEDPKWYEGAMNYGIRIPTVSTPDDLHKSIWVWDKPTGGSTAPYRLSDFVGYRHKSPKPWYSVPAEMYTNKDLQKNVARLCFPMSESDTVGFDRYSKHLLHPDGEKGKYYAAILVKDQSNDGGYIKTYEAPINGNAQPINFNFDGLPEKYRQGRLNVICFFATMMLTQWTSATRLPIGFGYYGGYGHVSHETYVTEFAFPRELYAHLDRHYEFKDMAEPVYIVIRNTRTDGQYIDLGDGTHPNKVKLDYDVTSASGEYSKASNQYIDIVAGNRHIGPGETCTIRFDRLRGYTENGQEMFPPDGFVGWCNATLYYDRRNDTPGVGSSLLLNIDIKLTSSF